MSMVTDTGVTTACVGVLCVSMVYFAYMSAYVSAYVYVCVYECVHVYCIVWVLFDWVLSCPVVSFALVVTLLCRVVVVFAYVRPCMRAYVNICVHA